MTAKRPIFLRNLTFCTTALLRAIARYLRQFTVILIGKVLRNLTFLAEMWVFEESSRNLIFLRNLSFWELTLHRNMTSLGTPLGSQIRSNVSLPKSRNSQFYCEILLFGRLGLLLPGPISFAIGTGNYRHFLYKWLQKGQYFIRNLTFCTTAYYRP